MALQGDLDSFPLADVLSLLAATAKSGRLEVQAATGTGELWLRRGNLIGGAASASPHVEQPDEVVYELLRLGGGLFHFDDIEVDDDGPEMAATDAIARAEALVAEWSAIESVVPSVWSSLALRAELNAPVTVAPAQWRVLAVVAGGATSRTVADVLGLTDLAACGAVRDLVDAGMVEVGEEAWAEEPAEPTAAFDPAAAPMASAEPADPPEVDPHAEVAHLSAEGGPVVIEHREDALLPEPLPGEGVEFHGEVAGSVVDRHRYDLAEPAPSPTYGAVDTYAAAAPTPNADAWGRGAEHDDDIFVSETARGGWDPSAPVAEPTPLAAVPSGAEAVDEDDRDSLMRFLSTVKP